MEIEMANFDTFKQSAMLAQPSQLIAYWYQEQNNIYYIQQLKCPFNDLKIYTIITQFQITKKDADVIFAPARMTH